MQLDLAAVRFLDRLYDEGQAGILLKGASFSRWLYSEWHARPYADVDILVRDVAAAGEIAKSMGYRWISDHPYGIHRTWRHDVSGLTLEIHSTLLGVGVPDARCWEVLSNRVERMLLVDSTIMILDETARSLHAVLHAAAHGRAIEPLQDLRHLLSQVEHESWNEVVSLGRELGALPYFVAGLFLLPRGRRLAGELGLSHPSIAARLRAAGATNAVQTLAAIMETRGRRSILLREALRRKRLFGGSRG